MNKSEELKLNILEKTISYIAPAWGAKRLSLKAAIKQARLYYDAARIDRLGSGWTAINQSAESTDASERDRIRARARDLERNSDIVNASVHALVQNVVGTGIKPQARIRLKNGKFDKKLNRQLEALWKRWQEKQADITGHDTFYGLQQMALRRFVVDGEIFLMAPYLKVKQGIPLRVQLLEADYVDSSVRGDNILSGVKVDNYHRPTSYYFYNSKPDKYGYTTQSTEIEAYKIKHLYLKKRPHQVRGISELAPVLMRIRDIEQFLEAEIVAQRMAACFALFIKTPNQMSHLSGRVQNDQTGQLIDSIEPGMIQTLRPGEDVATAEPRRNAGTAHEFTRMSLRRIGAGQGLSYEMVSRDNSQANYSSARQNHLEDRKTFKPLQEYIVTSMCKPIWRDFVRGAVLSGDINIPNFWSDPEKYYECEFVAPGWTWIDPSKDVKASTQELKSGMSTLSHVCGQQGKDWTEVLEQAAEEKQYAEQLGLNLDIYNPDPLPEGGDEVDDDNKQK